MLYFLFAAMKSGSSISASTAVLELLKVTAEPCDMAQIARGVCLIPNVTTRLPPEHDHAQQAAGGTHGSIVSFSAQQVSLLKVAMRWQHNTSQGGRMPKRDGSKC